MLRVFATFLLLIDLYRDLNCKALEQFPEPKNRMCYSSFKEYLARRGFTVYPSEFDCGNSKHPLVDIAARNGSFYWAFEYKSESDSISRGVEQVECYSHWFDYVVLVSEQCLDHTKSRCFWELASSGMGIWNYFPSKNECFERKNPQLQNPEKKSRNLVARRFRALNRYVSHTGVQTKLSF